MAGTTTKSRVTAMKGSAEYDLRLEHNKLADDIETVRTGLAALAASFNLVLAKLDLDAGVTDTNYASLRAVVTTTYDVAGDLTAAKVGNLQGTTT